MPKIPFLLSAGLLALAGCASSGPSAPAATTTSPAAPVAPDPKGVGLDLADLDCTMSPCDDFYEFLGGN